MRGAVLLSASQHKRSAPHPCLTLSQTSLPLVLKACLPACLFCLPAATVCRAVTTRQVAAIHKKFKSGDKEVRHALTLPKHSALVSGWQ